MTFRVVLYYVGPDSHVFMSCDVVELGLSSMELVSSLVEICFCLFFVLLRAYSLGIQSTFWSFGNPIFALV